jgi:hypothetical protein
MFGRALMISIITLPTAPVAPTSAKFGRFKLPVISDQYPRK